MITIRKPKKRTKPKLGDIRYRKFFAWFPFVFVTNDDICICWLEDVYVKERYDECWLTFDGYPLGWHPITLFDEYEDQIEWERLKNALENQDNTGLINKEESRRK